MGKASKKMKRNQEKKIMFDKYDNYKSLKIELRREYEKGEYDNALNTLAQIIENGDKDVELMYCGACIYFKLEDYTRSVQWIDNTLRFAPNHVDARILLAKICSLEERWDDTMSIYEFIMNNYSDSLTENRCANIRDCVKQIWDRDHDWIRKKYASVYTFMCKNDGINKELIDTDAETDIVEIMTAIASRHISVNEKVKMLNAFAGAAYIDGNYIKCEKLLLKALEFDEFNDITIKNMAILHKDRGKKEVALSYAARLSYTDFSLLKILNE